MREPVVHNMTNIALLSCTDQEIGHLLAGFCGNYTVLELFQA